MESGAECDVSADGDGLGGGRRSGSLHTTFGDRTTGSDRDHEPIPGRARLSANAS